MKKSLQRIKNKKKFLKDLPIKEWKKCKIQVKKFDFIIITCHYKGNTAPTTFIGFKGPLGFYKNIEEAYITLEKAKENQK